MLTSEFVHGTGPGVPYTRATSGSGATYDAAQRAFEAHSFQELVINVGDQQVLDEFVDGAGCGWASFRDHIRGLSRDGSVAAATFAHPGVERVGQPSSKHKRDLDTRAMVRQAIAIFVR